MQKRPAIAGWDCLGYGWGVAAPHKKGRAPISTRYPYEGLVVAVGTAAIIIPLGMWMKAKSDEWPLLPFLLFCLICLGLLLLIGHLVDRRDAARRREVEQALGRVLDLPTSDYQSQSSPGKPE